MTRPLSIVCLHYLGGSAREFGSVAGYLGDASRLIALDLPGFGAAREVQGYAVADMAAYVVRSIRERVADRDWLLVGHSMGAKVAAVIARFAQDGAVGLAGLKGLITLAGSPPGPEPMQDEKRQTMLGWFCGDHNSSAQEARNYIRDNVSQPLQPALAQIAEDDVLGAHPDAWRAWLLLGSREDLSAQVGVLRLPTLIVAGDHDDALGTRAQMQHALPHYANSRLQTLGRTGHLLPLERAQHVADLIKQHEVSL